MSGGAGEWQDWEKNLTARLEVFVDQWKSFQGTEQSGAQQFLQALLDIYGASFLPGTIFEQHPVRIPARAGAAAQRSLFPFDEAPQYTTERMDMYLPKVCVWEMKAPAEKNLDKHHAQVLGYWARVRTRYMVLCNFQEFWIYDTDEENGQLAPKLKLALKDLPACADALLFLRGEKPDLAQRSERVTAEVASMLGRLLRELRVASPDPERAKDRIAKFILECVFAMFAEDTELMPPRMFTDHMREAHRTGRMDAVWSLFDDFGRKNPLDRGNRHAPYVNGPLFDHSHPKISLTQAQIDEIYCAARDFDWQDVRPEIFGSIFEQAFDSVERHELGAHFTREADIARVIGPTIIEPWQQRIAAIRSPRDAERVVDEMRAFHVLDPACGCGNFLYVVYREMKRLEAALAAKWTWAHRAAAKRKADVRPPPARPYFTLHQIHGIEIEPFAAFLARVVLWIGEHLAKRELGLEEEVLPLKNLDEHVRAGDALLMKWPRPEGELAIVGNPPYLGVRKLRHELGDDYVETLFQRYPANRAADYVTYWFAQSQGVLRPGERAGFVCTNSIAQNESREASIDRLVAAGATLTDAWKSYPWPGEAAVHIGIVNWVMGPHDGIKRLDGREVSAISAALTEGAGVTAARPIVQNERLCFMGVTPGNHGFVLSAEERDEILAADPGSAPVIKPFLIGRDVNREIDQRPTRWIIDFGTMSKEEAERCVQAFRFVQRRVYSAKNLASDRKTDAEKNRWWQFVRPRPDLRAASKGLEHVIVIPCVSPHLIISRQAATICFDHQLMVVALHSPYHFGILQSHLHETWAWARGSTLEERLRYTNTTIFETFPFPLLPGGAYDPRVVPDTKQAARVVAAAEKVEAARSAACRERNLGLTKVHNLLKAGELPELGRACDALNDAVTALYGFPKDTWRDEADTLRRLFALNQQVATPLDIAPPPRART
jgi:hypothetical protein